MTNYTNYRVGDKVVVELVGRIIERREGQAGTTYFIRPQGDFQAVRVPAQFVFDLDFGPDDSEPVAAEVEAA